jgi:predicted XRE-type DNA-binding protein
MKSLAFIARLCNREYFDGELSSNAPSHRLSGMRTTCQILRALLDLGLSQTEIARRTGIPQPRLSRWAAGEVPASADDVLRLADLHGELVDRSDASSLAVNGAGY